MFVESVLRYGLPVNFQGMILLPQKKTQKKLRDSLNQLYTHLDSAGGSGDVSFEFVEYTYVVTCFNSSASRNLKHFGNRKNEKLRSPKFFGENEFPVEMCISQLNVRTFFN